MAPFSAPIFMRLPQYFIRTTFKVQRPHKILLFFFFSSFLLRQSTTAFVVVKKPHLTTATLQTINNHVSFLRTTTPIPSSMKETVLKENLRNNDSYDESSKPLNKNGKTSMKTPTSSSKTITNNEIHPSFDWEKQWYPLSPLMDLSRTTPNKQTILGMDVAVWYDHSTDKWCAVRDECPHRLVPLSEGRIDESTGHLQCAYHGWEFNGCGTCVRIPQLSLSPADGDSDGNKCYSDRSNVSSFPVMERQGLLWIYPSSEQSAASSSSPALIPALDDPSYVDATNFYMRDLPYSWDILVENLLDPSHVSFAHHGYMNGADRYNPPPIDLVITTTTTSSSGFAARKDDDDDDPQPTVTAVSSKDQQDDDDRYDITFTPPCLIFYDIRKGKTHLGLGQYCIPIAPHRCRVITRFPFRLPIPPVMMAMKLTPRWFNHLSQNIVLDSDVVFLASQDQRLRETISKRREGDDEQQQQIVKTTKKTLGYYMPARSDAMIATFRKWLGRYGTNGEPAWIVSSSSSSSLFDGSAGDKENWIRPTSIPFRGGRDALLDRYRQHTDICSSCRKAHKILYMLRDVCRGLGGVGVVIAATVMNGKDVGAKRRVLVAALSWIVGVLIPRFVLRPLIVRLECVPWPRRQWIVGSGQQPKRKGLADGV